MIGNKIIFIGFVILLVMVGKTSTSQIVEDLDTIPSSYSAEFGISTVITSGDAVPFWMRSQRYGAVPLDGLSAVLEGRLKKHYSKINPVKFDWGGNLDIRINAGNRSHVQIIEAYVKARYSIFQLKVGREREFHGLVDSVLSSGSFSLSGNALGIPKIELSVPEYKNLPFLKKLIAFKGDVSYGTMGQVPIQFGDNKGDRFQSFYHHLTFSGRIGKPSWKIKFEAGINHDVIWGSDKLIFGDQYSLSNIETLFYVFTGKKFKGSKDISKIGNHLGSIDFATEYNFDNLDVRLYHQFLYDKGALVYLANVKDGLTGVSLTNRSDKKSKVQWRKILFEFVYTKDQAGQNGAKFTPSGPEYYYNHAVYTTGFSYKGLGLGMPLITPAHLAQSGQASDPSNYFINNRIVALHVGLTGSFKDWDIILKSTYSKNFGDYRTSGPKEQWFNGKRVVQTFNFGKFNPVNQFSGYVEASKAIKNGYHLGFVLANDHGGLLNNSIGGIIKLSKKW